MKSLPARAKELLAILSTGEHKAWLVGGCVRDRLLARKPKDYDLATTRRPDQILEICTQHQELKAYPTGVDHGTITIRYHHHSYEVTTLREDIKCHGRKAEVMFGRSLERDAQRRDFTINALYEDRKGKIYDYVGGVEDLKRKVVRFVGDPRLRILRFFRVAQHLDFDMDSRALIAAGELADQISTLSKERVYSELIILFTQLSCRASSPAERTVKKVWWELIHRGVFHHCGQKIPDDSALSSAELEEFLDEFVFWCQELPMVMPVTQLKMAVWISSLQIEAGQWHQLYKSSNAERQIYELWCQMIFSWRQWLQAEDYPVTLMEVMGQARRLMSKWCKEDQVISVLSAVEQRSAVALRRCGRSELGGCLQALEYTFYHERRRGFLRNRCYLTPTEMMKHFQLQPGKKLGQLVSELKTLTWQEKITSKQEALAYVRAQLVSSH